MEKSDSEKFRDNLKWFLQIKMITPEVYESLMAQDIAHETRKIDKKAYKAWICVNPPPESISLEDLYNFSVANLPYQNYILTTEQNTDSGVRPHVHILAKVNSTTRPNAEISRLAKLYNVKENFVECKICKNNLVNISRLKYVRGEKMEAKKQNVEKDIKDRELVNIPNYYLKGIL
ncbi:MAG: hypothetical protein [Cressdnaviricota sp.]|nr:MAG: hypothetical protein [Cressdnaviricota sp.]